MAMNPSLIAAAAIATVLLAGSGMVEYSRLTPEVRDEFLAVLRADQGFTPYIDYGADQPVAPELSTSNMSWLSSPERRWVGGTWCGKVIHRLRWALRAPGRRSRPELVSLP